jgi:hypothetical protein
VLSLHDLTALLRGRQVSAGLWADSGEAGSVPQQPEPLKQASYRMLKDASGRLFHRPAEGARCPAWRSEHAGGIELS